MQFTTVLALLVAGTGVSAAPTEQKRLGTIPLAIYTGSGCNSTPQPEFVANIPTDGSCFTIGPINGVATDSGLLDTQRIAALPAGCTLQVFSDFYCSSTNVLHYDASNECRSFGTTGKYIESARTVGTCA